MIYWVTKNGTKKCVSVKKNRRRHFALILLPNNEFAKNGSHIFINKNVTVIFVKEVLRTHIYMDYIRKCLEVGQLGFWNFIVVNSVSKTFSLLPFSAFLNQFIHSFRPAQLRAIKKSFNLQFLSLELGGHKIYHSR